MPLLERNKRIATRSSRTWKPADPTVILYEGTYYLYPTHGGRGYDAFVSEDLVHW